MREWTHGVLADVADIRPSNVDKLSIQGEQPVRLCNYMNVYANERITTDLPFMAATAAGAEIARFRVETGDVILTKDSETPDDIGIPAVVSEAIPDLVCGYHLALLKPRRGKIYPAFLAKQLGSSGVTSYFARAANGSTRYGLSYGAIARTPLRWPVLSQQRRIAEILSTLDEVIEQTEALIAKTQAIKAGLMHDLFTRGVTANGELRPSREEAPQLYKPSLVGWIPKEWHVSSFGTCLLGSPQNGLYKPATEYVESGTSIVRIDSFYDGAIQSLAELKRVRLTPTEQALYGLAAGDILINRVNSLDYVGKSAIVPELLEALVFESNMMRCRVNQTVISPQFATRWLGSPIALQHFQSRAKSAVAQASINQTDVRSLPVKLPDAAEQQRIYERASAVEAAIQCERQSDRELLGLKQGLMHDLLTGRVPVPLPEPEALGAEA